MSCNTPSIRGWWLTD
jgi:DnaJ-class molecular chaperone